MIMVHCPFCHHKCYGLVPFFVGSVVSYACRTCADRFGEQGKIDTILQAYFETNPTQLARLRNMHASREE